MSGKRLHHYIPQFYLRGFTDPSVTSGKTPWLWVRHKESSAVVRKAPKNLAAEIGYYAVETTDGLDYATVENELAAIESRAAFALRKFLDGPTGHRKIEPDLSAGWQFGYLGLDVRRKMSGSVFLRGLPEGGNRYQTIPLFLVALSV